MEKVLSTNRKRELVKNFYLEEYNLKIVTIVTNLGPITGISKTS